MKHSISTTAEDQHHLVDQTIFRYVIGHFVSGVTIITARHNGTNFGLTASSVCSVSLDPPMLLVCINRQASTHDALAKAGVFAVHILGEQQQALARLFAASQAHKFNGLSLSYGTLGAPVLSDALAWLECRVVQAVTAGTHSVFLATVHRATANEGLPLTYFRGMLGRFLAANADPLASLRANGQG